jgi:hypothetical protein
LRTPSLPQFDGGTPWTIPNLVLHDKPMRLANMRTHGRRHVFVNCGNPDCYHNAELDVSGLPDNVTFGKLQRRMLCTVCDHRGADVWPVLAASWLIGPPHRIGRQSGIAFLHPLRLTPANDRMGNAPC